MHLKRRIWLKDCAHIPVPAEYQDFPPAMMATARDALITQGLRYDNTTGIIRDNSGELERYSNPKDHRPHADLESVMRREFSRYIANSASRILRGFEP